MVKKKFSGPMKRTDRTIFRSKKTLLSFEKLRHAGIHDDDRTRTTSESALLFPLRKASLLFLSLADEQIACGQLYRLNVVSNILKKLG